MSVNPHTVYQTRADLPPQALAESSSLVASAHYRGNTSFFLPQIYTPGKGMLLSTLSLKK